ncbi:PREDICTED: uncharacterized protein LOC104827671 [Tarenaya hassleriana]|uniref:uncharacterized protein LOC104827671 n=1 Tax=Tarenaya hassleriana TaxID=28532 RepID=UPI00053CAA02|nr:PREDICTED: uncharacterized protein LOC104827671 [Tarenaya hassleriana]
MDGVCFKMSMQGLSTKIPVGLPRVGPIGCSMEDKPTVAPPPEKKSASYGIPLRARRLEIPWPVGGEGANCERERRRSTEEIGETERGQKGNWVLKILQVGSLWRKEETVTVEDDGRHECESCSGNDEEGEGEEEEEEKRINGEEFRRMLRKVPLSETRLFAKMSYLGNLAYSIPKIKPENLLKYAGLRFVTSSIEKRKTDAGEEREKGEERREDGEEKKMISPTAAYRIAASAASRLYLHSKSVIPFRSSRPVDDEADANSSLMATADSVTAVVAAQEEVKQAVADDLKSTRSPPCEWFVCDDDKNGTRFFFIQGSESLASWQANLLFEPVPFEELDVLVHRGIYEAAKGIYEQMLPEVHAHLSSRAKNRAFLRFTGHSLGGSLSLLVNLMLLIRGQAPASSLLPVVTFGSPCIMCGGERLLQKLGLPKSHLLAITMHNDIVPRAFSCIYPDRVARILKAVNGKFRNHPCLNKQKLLYSPMGELLILQPDEKLSPPHPLLPPGSGLYVLSSTYTDTGEAEKELRAAKRMFLNSPHPLEILSDRSAYGSEGIIKRDHDMSSYLKALKHMIRQELKRMKVEQEHRRVNFFLAAILRRGRESLKLASGIVASRGLQLVVMLFLPVRWLVVGVYGVISHH